MWPSYVVLLASIALCIVAYIYVRQTVQKEEDGRFDASFKMLQQGFAERTGRYADVLLFARAFCETTDTVTRDNWKAFVDSLDLRKRFPGTRALGYLQRVTDAEKPAHVARMRAEGIAGYTIRPLGDRAVYFPLVYSDPTPDPIPNARSPALAALPANGAGFDMYWDPTRKAAMDDAVTNDQPTATGRVAMLSETATTARSGFLVFMPIYRKGAHPVTPEERRAALIGFVYAPYRTGALMRDLAHDVVDAHLIHFQLYDSPTPSPDTLMFDSRALDNTPDDGLATRPANEPTPILSGPGAQRKRVLAAGRTWTLIAAPTATLIEYTDHDLPGLILVGGIVVSLLLFGISVLQMRARQLSEKSARDLALSERRLRASETRYRLKIEQSPVAVQTLTPTGRPVSVNRSWEQLWGVTLADLRDYNIFADKELDRQGVMNLVKAAFDGEVVTIGPIHYDVGDLPSGAHGRARWVRSVLYPVKDPTTGEITEVVFMHEDFTLRKEAEAELRRAKDAAESANHAKDQFLAVLSHELRNPLSPVLSMVDLLRRGDMSDAQQAEAMEVIRRNVELEARLIDDLLDVTRISRGKLHLDLTLTDAHTALRHAVQICRPEIDAKAIRLQVDLAAGPSPVRADPARLQQVFWNLINNAIKFTPQGGAITLHTHLEPAAPHTDPSRDGSPGEMVIEVSDTGIGVPPEKLSRIFDAFEQADGSITRRFGGLGLGLTITRALVEAHGGMIAVSSEGSGTGTTFTVRLPLAPEAAGKPLDGSPTPPTVAPTTDGRKKRILLIEDQTDARRGLQLLLQRDGFDVKAVATGSEALAAAAEFPFDIVVSDIGLPDLSGFDLLPKLRQLRSAPAIALTGFGMEQDVQLAADAGFELHMTKPVSFDRLLQAIASLATSNS